MAITDKDIKKLSGVFATKDEMLALEGRVTGKMESLEGRMTEKIEASAEKTDQVKNILEDFIKKVENINEDRKVELLQYQRQESKLENHETRLVALEAAA